MTSGKPHYENVPFEIPKSWEWVRLGEISNYGSSIHNNVENIDDRAWILELEDVEKDSGKIIHKVTKKDREISGVRNCFTRGQVLYAKLRTYLNKVLVAPLDGYCTTEIIPFSLYGEISPYYIAHVLRSIYFIDYTTQCCYGCKMPRLGTNDALNGLIPLPPIAEQKRIESEITKCFALLEEVDANKRDLQETIKQVKGKILSFGINGYLVPQDPNDEPAIELLRRMKPDLTPCDTSHYRNIPQNWCVCRLKDIFEITMGSSPSGDSLNRLEDGVEFHQGKICFTDKYLSKSGIYTNSPTKIGKKQSILLCVRAPVGLVNITDREICIGRGLCSLYPKQCVDLMFAFYAMQTYQDYFDEKATGSTFKAISGNTIREAEFLLPPYEEQIRIRVVLETILSILDNICKVL